MLDFADLANIVLARYYPLLTRTTFGNRMMFDFPSTPYSALAGEDGPEENLPRGLLRVDSPEGGLTDYFFVETSTTHAAAELTEFGVPGAAGGDVISRAEPGTISAIIPVEITGFALDAAQKNNRSVDLIDVVAQHFISAFKRLGDYVNNVLVGTGVNSLFGAMDATTQYAGLNPAVLTQWRAYENTTGGLLTEAILEDVWSEVTGGDRRASPEDLVWLFPYNQIRRYRAMGRMVSANAAVQKMVLADGRPLDLGHSGQAYNERPIVNTPDAPTTEVGLLNTAKVHIKEVRSLAIEQKSHQGDGKLWYATWRGKLMYPNKHQSGKASALTA